MGSEKALRGVTNRMVRDVLTRAVKAGCEVRITRAGHLQVTTPNGAVIHVGMTQSSPYAHVNLLRTLRHNGVSV